MTEEKKERGREGENLALPNIKRKKKEKKRKETSFKICLLHSEDFFPYFSASFLKKKGYRVKRPGYFHITDADMTLFLVPHVLYHRYLSDVSMKQRRIGKTLDRISLRGGSFH